MKTALAFRFGSWLRWLPTSAMWERGASTHGLPLALYCLVAGLALLPMYGPGSPPGVDAPTFLHLGWAVEQMLTGGIDLSLTDEYWYGGFPFIQSYSPLSYGLMGLVAAATPVPLELVYRALTLIALAAIGASVYWLALEFGLRRSMAFWSGLLAMGSYPVFTALGVFGWFSTLVALPFGVTAYTLLERANRTRRGKPAVLGGVVLACALLAHHMTAFGLVLGLVPWALYHWWAGHVPRERLIRNVALFSAVTLAVSGVWAFFFLAHMLSVGFEREIAGNWSFDLEHARIRMFNRDMITVELYPSYFGWVQVPLALGAMLQAFVTRARIGGLAALLLGLTWFSLGTDLNPLIKLYPFSGLDVARFAFFMVPFMAVLAGYLLSEILAEARALRKRWGWPSWTAPAGVGVAAALLLVVPAMDVRDARPALSPVQAEPVVKEVMDWLAQHTAEGATVMAVGFRNWDSYWVPTWSERRLMDGWHDEAAPGWETVREMRHMGWFGRIDLPRLYQIMQARSTDYLVVYRWDLFDSPQIYELKLRGEQDLFAPQAAWPNVTIYRRLPGGAGVPAAPSG